jgi:Myb-like DNA-binding domain
MGRWRRHLDPNIRKCQWLDHEDQLLKDKYNEQGPQWSNISKFLDGRTAQQCRARWFQLCPQEAAAQPAAPAQRHGNNRKDRVERHKDGAFIKESARLLLSQMEEVGELPADAAPPRRTRGPQQSRARDSSDSDEEEADEPALSPEDSPDKRSRRRSAGPCAGVPRRAHAVSACFATRWSASDNELL